MSVTETAPATMTARPSITASTLAIGAAVITVVQLGVGFVPVVAVCLGGLGLVTAGSSLRLRGWSIPGLVLSVVGVAVGLGAVGFAGVRAAGEFSTILWTVPGVLGIVLLGLAVVPLRGSGTRWLVKAGAGALFLSVILAGLFRAAPVGTLLVAMAGTVVAWDAGEHAIDVGRQLGRGARTRRLDMAHVGATIVVGGVAVLVGHAVDGMQAGELSLSAFAVLFLALIALTVALHR